MPPQRVLVVDDEQYYRDTIRDALSLDGIGCEVAASPAEVLKAIEDPRVACVVLDVSLDVPASFAQPDEGERRPGNALGLIETLLEARPALRVIALATQSDQELVLAALQRGACDYLAKPIHDEELCLAVHRALRAHAVEARFESLRERLWRLAEHGDAIGRAARSGADREMLAARAVAAAAEVVDAARVSLLWSPDGSPPNALASEGVPVEREDDADVAAPLELGDGQRAALCARERRGGGEFGAEDEALLRVLARGVQTWLAPPVAAPAPAATVPAEAPERDAEGEAELLRAVAEGMTRETQPERLLAASLRPIARATSARVVSLYLIDNATGRLVCEAQCEGTDVDRADLPRGSGLTGGSLQSGAIVATESPARDARFDPEVDTPESGMPGAVLVIPLRVRDRVLGVARVFPGPGVAASAHLGELLAAPLSAATRNVLLYRSLLESVEDVARARREAEGRRQVAHSPQGREAAAQRDGGKASGDQQT